MVRGRMNFMDFMDLDLVCGAQARIHTNTRICFLFPSRMPQESPDRSDTELKTSTSRESPRLSKLNMVDVQTSDGPGV